MCWCGCPSELCTHFWGKRPRLVRRSLSIIVGGASWYECFNGLKQWCVQWRVGVQLACFVVVGAVDFGHVGRRVLFYVCGVRCLCCVSWMKGFPPSLLCPHGGGGNRAFMCNPVTDFIFIVFGRWNTLCIVSLWLCMALWFTKSPVLFSTTLC